MILSEICQILHNKNFENIGDNTLVATYKLEFERSLNWMQTPQRNRMENRMEVGRSKNSKNYVLFSKRKTKLISAEQQKDKNIPFISQILIIDFVNVHFLDYMNQTLNYIRYIIFNHQFLRSLGTKTQEKIKAKEIEVLFCRQNRCS